MVRRPRENAQHVQIPGAQALVGKLVDHAMAEGAHVPQEHHNGVEHVAAALWGVGVDVGVWVYRCGCGVGVSMC